MVAVTDDILRRARESVAVVEFPPAVYAFFDVPCPVEDGARLSRNEVTRRLIDYIKEKGLRSAPPHRGFVLDAPLAELFGREMGEAVAYWDAQKLLGSAGRAP